MVKINKVKLSEISEFITKGSTPTTYGFNWVDSGVLFLRSECVSESGFDLKGSMFISDEANNAMARSKIKAGDLLMTITGNVGRVCVVPNNIETGNINQHIAKIAIKSSNLVNRDFVFHYLNQDSLRDLLFKITTGQAYPQLSLEQVRNIEIPLFSINEQKQIAEIFNTYDLAIEKAKLLISKKISKKKALMQKMLTGKLRFKGFEKEKWVEETISEMCKTFSGGTPLRSKKEYYGGTIPWLKSGELNNEKIYETEETITEEGLKNSSAKMAEAGSILLALYGATAGVVAQTLINTTLNQAILAIVPNSKLSSDFLFYYLKLIMPFELNRLLQGGQPNLSAEMIKDLTILIPSINEQKKITEVLTNSDEEILKLKAQFEKLKLQKKGLMQLLFTGKINVK